MIAWWRRWREFKADCDRYCPEDCDDLGFALLCGAIVIGILIWREEL